MLSNRSSAPPWPGIIVPVSLILNLLFSNDMLKSLICAIMPIIRAKKLSEIFDSATIYGRLYSGIRVRMLTLIIALETPIIRPLIVLFGLVLGANLGPPISLPPNIAIISTLQMMQKNVINSQPLRSM